ncbi:MAG TPA: LPS export ABC transporter permease LptG [Burkholderiales bacterium]|nr:LPS export ABC transporter permease LptG [Burkholderiales bacterium]
MRILRRYLFRQIVGAILLVLIALIMLFSFFDLIYELRDVGTEGYRLYAVLTYVALSIPGHLYELLPVAALIGTLFALAQLVVHSEYAVMRTSGMSILNMASTLLRTGLLFAVATFVTGEFLAPLSEEAAKKLRLEQTSSVVAQAFRSGLWVKEEGSFVNVARVLYDATLQGVRIYEFDDQYRLRTISLAREGRYVHSNLWRLTDVVQTHFVDGRTSVASAAEQDWHSVLTPSVLSVLLIPPEKMSLWTLYSYVRHLRENRQESTRYEIALWNKLIYPFAVLVMMLLALPFAYMNVREGGVSAKVFAGIMLGLSFHLLNRLFGHVGQLAAWPPILAAFVPTVGFLVLAVLMLRRLERR